MTAAKLTTIDQPLIMDEVLEDMFTVLTDREQEVITARFSLDDSGRKTLESIGQKFNVTRERIRQIESSALGKLRRTVENSKLRHVVKLTGEILESNDGLLSESELVSKVLTMMPKAQIEPSIVRLALAVNEDAYRVKKSNEFVSAWRLERVKEKHINDAARAALKALSVKDEVLSTNDVATDVRKALSFKPSTKFVRSVLSIHKEIKAVTPDTWGLMTWRHINPRSIHDKALIVLAREGKPLHFLDIANKIQEAQFDHKSVTVQAVHNELIRGEEFVLVGRGLYALKEWGYVEGTVADVIEQVLKKSGKPLPKSDIVRRVLELRAVKVGTIALNLQKQSRFHRVGRAVYALA